jgi:hypothetical protein
MLTVLLNMLCHQALHLKPTQQDGRSQSMAIHCMGEMQLPHRTIDRCVLDSYGVIAVVR